MNESETVDCGKLDLSNHDSVVVLLGAGASTSAGIPDFRSVGGLYETYGEDLFHVETLTDDPQKLVEFLREYVGKRYEPTEVHSFIKTLQDSGKLLAVITQNIDGLEKRAGLNENLIYPVHGSLSTFVCTRSGCDYAQDQEQYTRTLTLSHDVLPSCPNCGALLRPNIVMFGESLDSQVLRDSQLSLACCDLFICIGTSLKVTPVSELPLVYVPDTAERVWINRDRPPLSYARFFDHLLLGDCDAAINKIVV